MLKDFIYVALPCFFVSIFILMMFDSDFAISTIPVLVVFVRTVIFNCLGYGAQTKDYKNNLKKKIENYKMSSFDRNMLGMRFVSILALNTLQELIV